jgi:hypothetical protein
MATASASAATTCSTCCAATSTSPSCFFNNRIYGLTKGQYSPTSPEGTKTKTTPTGSIDHPINPLLFALGAEATFIARTIDNNPKHMVETFKAAHEHQGVSFVEIFQNCVIFNDSTWDPVYAKENRDDHLLFLEAGKPLLFGKNKEKGIRLNGLVPEVVDAATAAPARSSSIRPDHPSPLYSQMLATCMGLPDFPTPIGVIRRIQRPPTSRSSTSQIEEAKAKKGNRHLAGTPPRQLHLDRREIRIHITTTTRKLRFPRSLSIIDFTWETHLPELRGTGADVSRSLNASSDEGIYRVRSALP